MTKTDIRADQLSMALTRMRVGHGIDVHPFAPIMDKGCPSNSFCTLGGVAIPHAQTLVGHSDADALLHALTDALLGAAGKPDIGHFFPDTDASLKGISSLTLLSRAWKMLLEEGFSLINADCCLLAEAPRVAPYIDKMKETIGGALVLPTSRISIKASTTERLGFVGRGEGITASAVVLLLAPEGQD